MLAGESAPEPGLSPRPYPVASRRCRPIWLVIALAFATYGLYFFWWAGATWAEMKGELQDRNMHPFWHALAMLVPIYGLFRIHAHFRTLNEMLDRAGAAERVQPTNAVVAAMVGGGLGNVSNRLGVPGPVEALLALVTDGFIAWLLVQGQTGLNAYWAAVSGGSVPERVHWGEWITLVAGGLIVVLLYLALLTAK